MPLIVPLFTVRLEELPKVTLPVIEALPVRVEVALALNIRLPVMLVPLAMFKMPEVPAPTVMVLALIVELAVRVASLAMFRALMPLVEPMALLKVLLAVRFRVPVLAAVPSIMPPISEVAPMFNIELVPKLMLVA